MPNRRVHELRPERYHTTFGPHEPVLAVEPSDEVVAWCLDARGLDADGEPVGVERLAGPAGARRQVSNPVTGPIHVAGAEPGDALVVAIQEVLPTRGWAWPGRPRTSASSAPRSCSAR